MQEMSSVPFVLGVDSGGTKYLVRAAALDGTILSEYRGSCCSHYLMTEAEASARIAHHLAACLETFGGRPKDCRYIVCGTTGYDSPEDGVILQRLYEGLTDFDCPALCMNDVELAFRVACHDEGVLILAGTGSICYARKKGETEGVRVGGWPDGIFGDEGAGRYIDALAMRHYSRWLDGCRGDSPLLRGIREMTGITTRKQLMDFAVALPTGSVPAPNLGRLVSEAAEAGDPWAAEILRDAAQCLFRLTEETIVRAGMQDASPLYVGVWGSVLMQSTFVRREMAVMLENVYPAMKLLIPEKDAAQGAVEIALEQLA